MFFCKWIDPLAATNATVLRRAVRSPTGAIQMVAMGATHGKNYGKTK
ncbi:hypothetical protein Desti_3212 [Desulfomonile tiedjei DSM 6799]|uniref:Uncharacterized protein n=1 Tax=Desulfomonile tiedjei (strain ATCC 49306 / DSM 6799 / DCB-1) TaxID=706587 RepID=I4C8I2_DESTA|nr:hypothetical protein Desti_3212 [Desulfomonile tiedjei DSM 6799]